jgi:hypothetical protein
MSSWKIIKRSGTYEDQKESDKILVYKFYIDLFKEQNPDSDPEVMIDKHFILGKRLLKLSEEYMIKQNDNKVESIYYKGIPLDLSGENYLFMKYMKFHSSFLKFSEWYKPNNFEKIEIEDLTLNDYIAKQFYVCLEKNKRNIKDKINELTDFQLISNICIRERLMFFNYLLNKGTKRRSAQNFINSEYMRIFRNTNKQPEMKSDIKKININDLFEVYSKH